MRGNERPLGLNFLNWKVSTVEDYEKLGAFYLGRPYDLKEKQAKDGILLYDSKDRDSRSLCRHDRQRQDGTLHRAA